MSPPPIDLDHDKLDLYEFMAYIGSHKWLMATGIAVGLAIGGLNYANQPPITTQTEVVFDIYSGGTPAYGPKVVADQLATWLTSGGYQVTTIRGSLPLVVLIDEPAQVDALPGVVDNFERLVDAQVSKTIQQLKQWMLGDVPGALTQYLLYQAYEDGRSDDTIKLVSRRVVKTDSPHMSLASELSTSAVAGLVVALALCVALFIVRNWRRQRQ